MTLLKLLAASKENIIDEATEILSSAPLRHYKECLPIINKKRLTKLFDLTVECISKKDLIPMLEFSQQLAKERCGEGFDLHEIYKVFNILEEIIWGRIAEKLDPSQFKEAFGLTSTVLGFGKETLATTYVSIASRKEVHSLDLSALFKGTN